MTYLVDTSVFLRSATQQPVRERLTDLSHRNVLRACAPVMLEVGFTARDAADHALIVGLFESTYPMVHASAWAQQRAVNVQGMLAARGQHRSARLADLLIAAIAEQHELTVLHHDADFDTVAAVTGQPTEWVVPRGSVS